MVKKSKWRFAIGTTSRVPGSDLFHYLMLDIDEQAFDSLEWLTRQNCIVIVEPTPHGYHVYTNLAGTFDWVCRCATMCGADDNWLRIGRQRGYLFLADKTQVQLPWSAQRMILHAKEKA